MTKPDILDQLVDFERFGLTATERFEMRMAAFHEIKRLRDDNRRQRDRRLQESTIRAIEGRP